MARIDEEQVAELLGRFVNDLVTVFDALHDMGDPVAAAAHIRQSLAPDGAFLLVEPYASDRLELRAGAEPKVS